MTEQLGSARFALLSCSRADGLHVCQQSAQPACNCGILSAEEEAQRPHEVRLGHEGANICQCLQPTIALLCCLRVELVQEQKATHVVAESACHMVPPVEAIHNEQCVLEKGRSTVKAVLLQCTCKVIHHYLRWPPAVLHQEGVRLIAPLRPLHYEEGIAYAMHAMKAEQTPCGVLPLKSTVCACRCSGRGVS